MATNYNKRNNEGSPPDLLLILGVGAFIVACFFVGYFVTNKKMGGNGNDTAPIGGATAGQDVVRTSGEASPKGRLTIVDNNAAMEERRKKAEEEAKKKAEEEAKKKLEEEATKLAEKEAKENSASPSPTASPTPDPDDLPATPAPEPTPTPEPVEPIAEPTPTPKPSPSPSPKATPKPKPSPTPTPATGTPDDPEDQAMMPQTAPSAAPTRMYRVRVGTFDAKENAEARAAELRAVGYEASLSTDVSDGKIVYRVQVAAYKSEKSAQDFAKQVQSKGFRTTISRN